MTKCHIVDCHNDSDISLVIYCGRTRLYYEERGKIIPYCLRCEVSTRFEREGRFLAKLIPVLEEEDDST